MAKLKDLSNNRVNRKIREVIENGEETIYVYEPSADDVEFIIELHDRVNENSMSGELSISGEMMVKEIFPRLTNLEDVEELTEDEIAYVIANPSIAMLQVQHVIEIIVTQVYKTVILSARKNILDADFQASTTSYIGSLTDKAFALNAATNEKAAEILHKIDDRFEAIDKMTKDSEPQESTNEDTKQSESADDIVPMGEYEQKILQYRQNFTEKGNKE